MIREYFIHTRDIGGNFVLLRYIQVKINDRYIDIKNDIPYIGPKEIN